MALKPGGASQARLSTLVACLMDQSLICDLLQGITNCIDARLQRAGCE